MLIAVNCFEIDPTSSTDRGESATPMLEARHPVAARVQDLAVLIDAERAAG